MFYCSKSYWRCPFIQRFKFLVQIVIKWDQAESCGSSRSRIIAQRIQVVLWKKGKIFNICLPWNKHLIFNKLSLENESTYRVQLGLEWKLFYHSFWVYLIFFTQFWCLRVINTSWCPYIYCQDRRYIAWTNWQIDPASSCGAREDLVGESSQDIFYPIS